MPRGHIKDKTDDLKNKQTNKRNLGMGPTGKRLVLDEVLVSASGCLFSYGSYSTLFFLEWPCVGNHMIACLGGKRAQKADSLKGT